MNGGNKNNSVMYIYKLSKLDKILIRWGYATKNYKRYQKSMQRALDNEHLNVSDYIKKYYA